MLLRFSLKCASSAALLVVTGFLMHAAWGMYGKMAAAAEGQESAQHQLASLEAQQEGVSSTLSEISSEHGEEAQIRERFGFAKPGEGEIDIIADLQATSTASTAAESWLGRLFNIFKVW